MLISLVALLIILIYYQKEVTQNDTNKNINKENNMKLNGDDIDFDQLIDNESIDLDSDFGSEYSDQESRSIETIGSEESEFSDEYSDATEQNIESEILL